jgi:hypothetical protein
MSNSIYAPDNKPIHLIIGSTGLFIVGEGEWAATKHGERGTRAFKKLHLGVDRSGVIVAEVLTEVNADDAKTALDLIDEVDGDIASFAADAACYTIAMYDAAAARGAKVVIRPTKTATGSAATKTTGERSQSYNHEGEGNRMPPVEEGVGLPSTSPS